MIEWLAIAVAFAGAVSGTTNNIPEPLIRSISFQESRHRDRAKSACLARGRLQARLSSYCRGCRNKSEAAEFLHFWPVNRYVGTLILSRWLKRANRQEACRGCREAWTAALRGFNGGNKGLRGVGAVGKKSGWYAARVIRGWRWRK